MSCSLLAELRSMWCEDLELECVELCELEVDADVAAFDFCVDVAAVCSAIAA